MAQFAFQRCQVSCKRGFTLLEMSIVLLIIALMLGGALTLFKVSIDRTSTKDTDAKLAVLQQALLDYRRAYGRLPCPANITLAPTSANFGVEAANGGVCFGGTPAANFTNIMNAIGGMVPTKTLGLPDDAAIDSWGRKILYAVDNRTTDSNPRPFTSISSPVSSLPDISFNRLIVRTTTPMGSLDKTNFSAMYVLISHGPNGHGGYPRSSATPITSNSTDVDELQNCHCNSAGTAEAFDNIFVQSTETTATYDDITVYGTRASLRTLAE